MDSFPSSRIQFLSNTGMPIDSPDEWMQAYIVLQVNHAEWQQVQLFCNQRPIRLSLTTLYGQIQLVADWPKSGVGHYQLHLKAPDIVEERIVTVWPMHLSQDAFAHMLDDLSLRLPAVLAAQLPRVGSLAGLQMCSPHEATIPQELLRLRQAVLGSNKVLGLVTLLPRIADAPHSTLRSTLAWMPQQQSRRLDPKALNYAVTRPGNLDANGVLKVVPEQRVAVSIDVYENQLLKRYVHQVRERLLQLQVLGRTLPVLKLSMTVLPEVDELLSCLAVICQRATFLDIVTLPTVLPLQSTMVFLHHPLYRAVAIGYRALNDALIVTLDDLALLSPLNNLPYLYQIWVTLSIMDVLLKTALAEGYHVEQQLTQRTTNGLTLHVRTGKHPLLVLVHPERAQRVTLFAERTYHNGNGLHSMSAARRPDVAIEIMPNIGQPYIYLFDAKYAMNDQKSHTADINQMHTYRDAILNGQNQPAVRYAAILYLGQDRHYGPGLEALRALPGQTETLIARLEQLCRTMLTRH